MYYTCFEEVISQQEDPVMLPKAQPLDWGWGRRVGENGNYFGITKDKALSQTVFSKVFLQSVMKPAVFTARIQPVCLF